MSDRNLAARLRATADDIERLTHPSGEQQIVGADDLWSVTSTAVGLQGLVELITDRVHSLEKTTGREWYGRG